jgi:hypothetical protein
MIINTVQCSIITNHKTQQLLCCLFFVSVTLALLLPQKKKLFFVFFLSHALFCFVLLSHFAVCCSISDKKNAWVIQMKRMLIKRR